MASVIDENTQFIDPLTSTPIVNGYIYIGANGLDAELNAITIYSDRDLTTPLSNPQRTDSSGRSVNKIWVPGRYSMKITDSADVQKLNDLDLGELAATGTTLLTNVQGSDTITAEGSPTITALTDGQLYVFTTILANAGAVTLKVDATPTYPVKKNHDVALVANDFEANQMIVVAWNSTDSVYELQSHTASGVITFLNDADLNGNQLIMDVDGDTSITADTDDQIDFKIGGADVISLNSTGILDANKNEIISVSATASAVNELTITNAATGNAPVISATGIDPNIDITLTPKGSGVVNMPSLISSGTWTPTIQDASFSDGEGQTYSTNSGSYVSIGNTVIFSGEIVLTSLGTLTIGDDAYIAGLPFTASNTPTASAGTLNIGYADNLSLVSAGQVVTGYIVKNTTRVILKTWKLTAGTGNFTITTLNDTSVLYFSGSYAI